MSGGYISVTDHKRYGEDERWTRVLAKKSLDIRKALEDMDYSTSSEDRTDGIVRIIVGEFKKNNTRFNVNDEIKIEINPHCSTILFATNRECTIKITYNPLELYESKMRFEKS